MSDTHTTAKVLIVTYYWPPAGGPGVQRWLKFARYLPEFGIEPVILTVDERFASYPLLDDTLQKEVDPSLEVYKTRTRELYKTYLKLAGREQIPFSGFVQESKPSRKEKLIRFLRTQLFIPDPRKGWNRFALKKASELIQRGDIRHVITTGPPHSTHLVGLRLKKRFPALKWIADFRDPWRHIFFFQQLNHSFYSRHVHKKLEKNVIRRADSVIVVGHSMKGDFQNDYPNTRHDKIVIVPNGFDEKDFNRQHPDMDKTFTITYTGTLAANYPLDALLSAIKTINKEDKNSVKLRFIGEINSEIKELIINTVGKDSSEFVSRVPHSEAIDYLYRSGMQLLVIPDAPGNKSILTGKLFEYLASGRPILGIGPEQGDAALVLQETDAGTMFHASKTRDILDYILKVKNEIQGHKIFYDKHLINKYSRKELTGSLYSLFT